MDNVIVDVVLGLVLVYLTMALLVSKVQEVWAGQLRAGRTLNLHALLFEAVGRDDTLKAKLLNNPSVFALSQGDSPAQRRGSWTGLWTSQGPSAIPPDMFARALLCELYGDGQHNHPSVRYIAPDAFVKEVGSSKTDRIWGTLRGLLTGNEGSWTGFESAIANWYKAIGERADGWYQRSAQTWSFWLAFGLAAMLNADTFHLADRLSNDPELRRSFSTLAQNVQALALQDRAKDSANAAKSDLPASPASLPPDRRAEQALNQAAALIASAYFRNDDFAKFDPNASAMGGPKKKNDEQDLMDQCAGASMKVIDITRTTDQRKDMVFLSNPTNWLYLMPALQTQVKRLRLPSSAGVNDKLENVHNCIANLSGWVALVAQRPSKDSAAQDGLRQAATALNQAADALLELLQDRGAQASFTRLFLADPEAFANCAKADSPSREGVRQCVLAAQAGRISLPIGWTASNRRLSFCTASEEMSGRAPSAVGWSDGLCGDSGTLRFDENKALRLRPMVIRGPGLFDVVAFVFGLVVTAFFVALGAPFWFDVLGRVVKLRAAGSKARDEALASPAGGAGTTTGGSGGGGGAGIGDEPFSLARNDTERAMTASDLIAVQGALGVERTGVWDKPTRQRIAEENLKRGTGSGDEMSNALFSALINRAPFGMASFQPPASSLRLHVADAQCAPVASALMSALAFPKRIDPLPSQLTDELRALAVLWRYKKEASTAPHLRAVRTLANTKFQLDTIDPADLAAILALPTATPPAAIPREPAPWLDWALGELGQAEACSPAAKSALASNPRILEYLKSAGLPNDPEDTAWCESFVCWVLTQFVAEQPMVLANPFVFPAVLVRAASYGNGWGTPIWTAGGTAPWPAGVQPGDIVTLTSTSPSSSGVDHVGFVLETDATSAWVISGNYSNRVGIDQFPLAVIAAVVRP